MLECVDTFKTYFTKEDLWVANKCGRMLNITHQGRTNYNRWRCCLLEWLKWKITNIKYRWDCGVTGRCMTWYNFFGDLLGHFCEVEHLWSDPASPLLSISLREMKIYVHKRAYLECLYRGPAWKWPSCPSSEEWLNDPNGMLQSSKENELLIQTNGGISKTEGHWPLSNTGVRGASPSPAQRSTYSIWLPQNLVVHQHLQGWVPGRPWIRTLRMPRSPM